MLRVAFLRIRGGRVGWQAGGLPGRVRGRGCKEVGRVADDGETDSLNVMSLAIRIVEVRQIRTVPQLPRVTETIVPAPPKHNLWRIRHTRPELSQLERPCWVGNKFWLICARAFAPADSIREP